MLAAAYRLTDLDCLQWTPMGDLLPSQILTASQSLTLTPPTSHTIQVNCTIRIAQTLVWQRHMQAYPHDGNIYYPKP